MPYLANQNIDPMTASELAKSALSFFLPVLKSKAVKQISSDFSEATNNEILIFWKKVKPYFIEEEIQDDLEKDPENATLQGAFEYSLTKKIGSNPSLESDIKSFISSLKDINPPKTINQIHYGSGDNVAGNKNVNGK